MSLWKLGNNKQTNKLLQFLTARFIAKDFSSPYYLVLHIYLFLRLTRQTELFALLNPGFFIMRFTSGGVYSFTSSIVQRIKQPCF